MLIFFGIIFVLAGVFIFLIGQVGENPENKFFNFFYELHWSFSRAFYSEDNKDLVKHGSRIWGISFILLGILIIFLSIEGMVEYVD